ncbi:MAG: hypothetical protein JXQ99_00280 [Hyphomicrobiaceae bacterium]
MSDTIDPPNDDDGNEPSNPFDPKRLRIAGGMSQGPTAKRILTNIQVRKPNRQEYFRVHPDPAMRLDTLLLEMRDDRLTYLVAPDIAPAIPGEAVAKTLYTTITRHGVILLWPVRLPDEQGRLDEWNAVAHQAALRAETKWIRLAANMGAGTYEVYEALDQFAEPEWPDLTLERLLEMAFKDRYIDDLDHPVVRRLMGEF